VNTSNEIPTLPFFPYVDAKTCNALVAGTPDQYLALSHHRLRPQAIGCAKASTPDLATGL